MGNRSPTFTCTAIELTCIASILGEATLTGVTDPFRGWLAEDIEAAWAEARVTLAARGAIRLHPSGTTEVADDIARLVRACASPGGVVMVSYTLASGQSESLCFHVQGDLLIQLERIGELYTLTPCESPDHVWQRINETLNLSERPTLTVPASLLPGEALPRARRLAIERGRQAAAEQIRLLNVPLAAAEALADTLTYPVGNAAVVSLVPRQYEWRVDGIGVLEGENGLWLMRSSHQDGQEWVRMTPTGKHEAEAEIRRLLTAALALPVQV